MKTFKSLLCVAACTVGFIGSVNAATLSIGNDTTEASARGRSVPLELKDDDLNEYIRVEFQLGISETSYASISSFSYTASGMSYSLNGETYVIENENGLLAKKLGDINYTTTENLNSNFKIVLNNVEFTKKDGTKVRPGTSAGVKKTDGNITYERPKSTEAALNALTVSQGTLSPAFDKGITEYKVQVRDTINSIKINATPCAGATVTGTGTKPLNIGENLIEVEVTAEDGSTKNTYTINVIRGEIAEPSAYIKELTINNIGVSLSPAFDPKNNKYTVNIDKNISELNFKYELEDPMAEVTISGNENYVEGENLVTIKVISSDGSDEQTYEITVIKEAEEESTEEPATPEEPNDKKEKKNNIWLIVGIVTVILIIIIGVSIILFKKKKDKKKKDYEESKLPLKRREGSEMTVEIDQVAEEDEYEPKHESAPKEESDLTEKESITELLKSELYEDDRTQRFDSSEFEDLKKKIYDEDEIDQTKEFDFKDFE